MLNVSAEQPAAKVKCVVWDLDNTLWGGTLIETDDPNTLELKPGVRELIEELDRRGIIQSVASKNDQAAAMTVLEHLGLVPEQAMAFGDSYNDMEMFKLVGTGIAMGNSAQALKDIASDVCGDVSEDGIYRYCLEKGLI